MGALPKKKSTRFRRASRARANSLDLPKHIACQNCKQPIPSHIVCPNCGFYRGRQFIKIKEKAKVKTVSEKSEK
jgi:large subunit ribosomal protein L32